MACNVAISGLPVDCLASIGGVSEVYITNADNVTAVTATDGKVTQITLATSAKFYKYWFRRNTASMTSTATIDPTTGANFVTTDLALQFNRMDTAKRMEIAALSVNEVVVIVKDANGVYWYLGYDHPVIASAADGATGTASTDANKYGITLQDISKEMPMEVEASIIADLIEA